MSTEKTDGPNQGTPFDKSQKEGCFWVLGILVITCIIAAALIIPKVTSNTASKPETPPYTSSVYKTDESISKSSSSDSKAAQWKTWSTENQNAFEDAERYSNEASSYASSGEIEMAAVYLGMSAEELEYVTTTPDGGKLYEILQKEISWRKKASQFYEEGDISSGNNALTKALAARDKFNKGLERHLSR